MLIQVIVNARKAFLVRKVKERKPWSIVRKSLVESVDAFDLSTGHSRLRMFSLLFDWSHVLCITFCDTVAHPAFLIRLIVDDDRQLDLLARFTKRSSSSEEIQGLSLESGKELDQIELLFDWHGIEERARPKHIHRERGLDCRHQEQPRGTSKSLALRTNSGGAVVQ